MVEESACDAGDVGSIPVLGRSPGEGNDNLLQCSCLENPMDREAWQATIHGVTRVRHNLATKPTIVFLKVHSKEIIFYKYYQFAYFVIVVQSLNCF